MYQLQNVQQAEYRQLLHMEAQEHAHLGHAMEQAQLRLDCEAREVEAVQEMEDFLEASKSSRLKLQQDMDRRIMEYTYKLAAVETECERLRSQCAWEMPLSELYSAQEVGYHELVHRAEQEYMDLVHAEEQARRDCESEARMQQCRAQASCEMEVCRLLCAQQVDHCALVRAEEADFVLMRSEAAKQQYTSNHAHTLKQMELEYEQSKARGVLERFDAFRGSEAEKQLRVHHQGAASTLCFGDVSAPKCSTGGIPSVVAHGSTRARSSWPCHGASSIAIGL
uniref:Uncharacterized protein n=1 Tax=Eutreptiella gymnastica TaxID=73025 RepID=A0A7S4FK13_9EUGL